MNEVITKNYILGPVDTDSISFCKSDYSLFSEKEQNDLINEINSLMPELIKYEHDGYFPKCICIRAKNYILYDGKKIKIKGSALKATTKPPALKEFIKLVIDHMIYEDHINNEYLTDLYLKYIKEINSIQDIKRWAARKTISEKVLESERTNETKLRDAIEGTELVEGDRCYTYYTSDNKLKLVEQFDGDYNKDRLLRNCYDTAWTFDSVLDCELLFKNYALKRNKAELDNLTK